VAGPAVSAVCADPVHRGGGLPPALVLGALWSANAGYISVLTMAAYYLMYEGLHTLSHLDDARHPYLKYIPLVNTVRRMHVTHHNLGFMQTRNFNLTLSDLRCAVRDERPRPRRVGHPVQRRQRALCAARSQARGAARRVRTFWYRLRIDRRAASPEPKMRR